MVDPNDDANFHWRRQDDLPLAQSLPRHQRGRLRRALVADVTRAGREATRQWAEALAKLGCDIITGGAPWRRWFDTALDFPHDIVPWETAPPASGDHYRVQARSVVMLLAGDPAP